MSDNDGYYNSVAEWELLDNKAEITNLIFKKGIYNLPQNCIIQFERNEDYRLKATIRGVVASREELNPLKEPELGGFFEDEVVSGEYLGSTFEITGFLIDNISFHGVSSDMKALSFVASIHIDSITKKSTYVEEFIPDRMIEWFLSSKKNLFFPRSTSRRLYQKRTKLRNDIDEGFDPDRNRFIGDAPEVTSGFSRDYLLVECKDLKFIIALVPKEFGPKWSENMCIEFRKEWGIPSKDTREAIREFASFVFCSNFLFVGSSSFDAQYNCHESFFCNAYALNAKHTCKSASLPVLQIMHPYQSKNIEPIFNHLLIKYLQQRRIYNLADVIAKYFVAKESYIGINLPILSSALEVLAELIIKEYFKKTQARNIPEKEFCELIAEELSSINNKLIGVPGGDKILNRIRGASYIGPNEKIEMMFEVLKLKIGAIEKKAIKTRNRMAHSSLSDLTEDEIRNYIKMTRAYETLFQRIILKILGYNNNYIDYHSAGHIVKHIDTPIST